MLVSTRRQEGGAPTCTTMPSATSLFTSCVRGTSIAPRVRSADSGPRAYTTVQHQWLDNIHDPLHDSEPSSPPAQGFDCLPDLCVCLSISHAATSLSAMLRGLAAVCMFCDQGYNGALRL